MEKYELSSEEINTIEHVIDDYTSDLDEQMNNEFPWSDDSEKQQVFDQAERFISIGKKLGFKSISPLLEKQLERLKQIVISGPGFQVEE